MKPTFQLSQIYNKEFFDLQARWCEEYVTMADILAALIPFSTALDLGCGNGLLLARLFALGKTVRGVDGSHAALTAASEPVKRFLSLHDLRKPLRERRFDLVICTEVAEHLEARFADTLIESICACSRGTVFFSAATPGQGGFGHVNEQPHAYWTRKFRRKGYLLDEDITASLRARFAEVIRGAWWFARNAMILRHRGAWPKKAKFLKDSSRSVRI
ncbi:MAG: class I SAM-dependent DNA methyltransferase [Limisphaerales bacterium]